MKLVNPRIVHVAKNPVAFALQVPRESRLSPRAGDSLLLFIERAARTRRYHCGLMPSSRMSDW